MSVRYDYTQTQVVIPAANNRVVLLGSRARRVSVILATGVSSRLTLSDTAGNQLADCWLSTQLNLFLILPFRDWGPLIQTEIWGGSSGGFTCQVTEVFHLPGCE